MLSNLYRQDLNLARTNMTCQDYRSELERFNNTIKSLKHSIKCYIKHTEFLRNQIDQKAIQLDEEVSMHEYYKKEKERLESVIRVLQIDIRNAENNIRIQG